MKSSSRIVSLFTLDAALKDIKPAPPRMPVDTLVQDAWQLHDWAMADKVALCATGLNWNLVAALPQMATALSEAEAAWQNFLEGNKAVSLNATRLRAEGKALLADLVLTVRFACDQNAGLQRLLAKMRRGAGDPALIQKLQTMASCCTSQRPALLAVGFDFSKSERAVALAQDLADITSTAHSARSGLSDRKYARDLAATRLKLALQGIRASGKFAFRGDAQRLAGYQNDYRRKAHATSTCSGV